ncbi:putative membrane protein [Halanaeroarchaeum sp. HSR-CO]|nr:putative membrane protein [Halanaeroarchaeum sp. HSR-CO]
MVLAERHSSMVVGTIVSFVVALLVGGLAIYIAANVVAGVDDYKYAIVTAFIGAVAWAIGSLIPLIGTLVALVAWIWVIKWRYPGGWKDAAIIGLVAWVSALVIIFILDTVLGLGISAFGVPGV